MRKQTREDLQKIQIEEDMLKGNINRMCITDDLNELESMAEYAKKRIDKILQINYGRLTEEDGLV